MRDELEKIQKKMEAKQEMKEAKDWEKEVVEIINEHIIERDLNEEY